jgi:hypothetical protein
MCRHRWPAVDGAVLMRLRRRNDAGSTVLEVALIGTTLFLFITGFITYALAQASDNAGVNAAREGARAAALNALCADAYVGSSTVDGTGCPTTPSAAYTAVQTAVLNKLGGLVVGTPQVFVTCLSGSSSNTLTPKPCNSSVVPDVDLVEVTVQWTREASNPISGKSTHSDYATATIQDSGKGSADTTACLANATVAPSSVPLAGQSPNTLSADVLVTIYTNGFCASPLSITFQTGPGNGDGSTGQVGPTQMQVAPNGTDFTYTIPQAQYIWDPGQYLIGVTDNLGNRITFVAQPQVTVTGTQCQFVSASLSPSSVIIAGGASSGVLSQPFTLSLTTTSGCQAVSAQFNPGGSSSQSVVMQGTAPNYSLTVSPGDPTPLQWTPGLKAFSFTDVSGGNVPLRNEQSVNLNVTTQCAITVTLNPAAVNLSGGNNLKSNVTVTATPALGADCSGLALTYAYSGGTSTQPMVLQTSGVYQYTISKNANPWAVNTYPITFSSNNSPSITTSPPTILTVN